MDPPAQAPQPALTFKSGPITGPPGLRFAGSGLAPVAARGTSGEFIARKQLMNFRELSAGAGTGQAVQRGVLSAASNA